MNTTHPTPYHEVNDVLHRLLSSVQTILGVQFVGMYLYGSLASGDFDPQGSDIDFLVVTADELADEMIHELEAMHARIAASGLKWATKLEGSYIPQRALRRYSPTDGPCPAINEGRFYLDHQGSDWVIQRHILREQGVVVAGPALQSLIDPIQANDLRQAVLGILRKWWTPMLRDPGGLRGSGYQAFAVLTMCRALYALQYGTIVSKPVAARWAQATLGEAWIGLIERALARRHDAQVEFDELNETLDFIRYTVERSQQLEGATNRA